VSYGQLAREAERVAAFLKTEGVEPGQRIGLLAPNDLTYLPAAFGLLAAGACFVPLASNLTADRDRGDRPRSAAERLLVLAEGRRRFRARRAMRTNPRAAWS